jgi:hypothetical protein
LRGDWEGEERRGKMEETGERQKKRYEELRE